MERDHSCRRGLEDGETGLVHWCARRKGHIGPHRCSCAETWYPEDQYSVTMRYIVDITLTDISPERAARQLDRRMATILRPLKGIEYKIQRETDDESLVEVDPDPDAHR